MARESSTDSEDDAESGYLGHQIASGSQQIGHGDLAGNDLTAHGVGKALRDRGLKIPDEISAAGCDDTVARGSIRL